MCVSTANTSCPREQKGTKGAHQESSEYLCARHARKDKPKSHSRAGTEVRCEKRDSHYRKRQQDILLISCSFPRLPLFYRGFSAGLCQSNGFTANTRIRPHTKHRPHHTLLCGSSHDLAVAQAQLVRCSLSQHLLKASQCYIEHENLLEWKMTPRKTKKSRTEYKSRAGVHEDLLANRVR